MENSLEKTPLLILCGGKSSRMGEPKGLIEIDNDPWLLKHLRNFSSIGGTKVLIVLGFDFEKYLKALPWLKSSLNSWNSPSVLKNSNLSIFVTINRNPELGQFSSLLCGLKKLLDEKIKAVFITPIDTPSSEKTVWKSLLSKMGKNIKVAMPEYKGRGGHPVLLSLDFIKEFINTPLDSEDARLDKIIKSIPQKNIAISTVSDERVALNVNYKNDFNKIK